MEEAADWRIGESARRRRREGGRVMAKSIRTATIKRDTTETQIALKLVVDGQGVYKVSTGIRFFDHMLELFTRHGGFDLTLKCTGDLDVDQHHTVGDFQSELLADFFDGFARGAKANVHVKTMYGRSNHHKIEAIFKAFARALRVACSRDKQLGEMLPSTKGLL